MALPFSSVRFGELTNDTPIPESDRNGQCPLAGNMRDRTATTLPAWMGRQRGGRPGQLFLPVVHEPSIISSLICSRSLWA